jgi:hypothetical protein
MSGVTRNYFLTQTTSLSFKRPQGQDWPTPIVVASTDRVLSTRGNANRWLDMLSGQGPVGEWKLALPDTPAVRDLFMQGEIEDILFVITYAGRTPAWPA